MIKEYCARARVGVWLCVWSGVVSARCWCARELFCLAPPPALALFPHSKESRRMGSHLRNAHNTQADASRTRSCINEKTRRERPPERARERHRTEDKPSFNRLLFRPPRPKQATMNGSLGNGVGDVMDGASRARFPSSARARPDENGGFKGPRRPHPPAPPLPPPLLTFRHRLLPFSFRARNQTTPTGMTAQQMFNQGVSYTYDDVIMHPGHINFGAHEVRFASSSQQRVRTPPVTPAVVAALSAHVRGHVRADALAPPFTTSPETSAPSCMPSLAPQGSERGRESSRADKRQRDAAP